MKKITTVLTAIVMLLASSAFAMEGEKVTPKVKAAFKTDFSSASKVNWKKTSDFYFATFTIKNGDVTAAYNEEGELIGTSRRISIDDVPQNVSLSIAEKFGDYKVDRTAIELTYEGQTRYYVIVDNDTEEAKLECLANGDVNVESKTKK